MKILNKFSFLISILSAGLYLLFFGQGVNVYAAPKDEVCAGVNQIQAGSCNTSDDGSGVKRIITIAIRIVQSIAGVLATFYLIYAGLKFISSSGGSDGVKSAKNMILYSSIGILIVLIAEGIIRFVLNNFTSAP